MNNKTLQYTIIIQAAEEGGYLAFVPSLPGCMTQGETVEEARENIKDAIAGYLKSFKKHPEERVYKNTVEIKAVSVVA